MKHLAILGATGAVGLELLKLLEERDVALGTLGLFASERSAGTKLTFKGETLTVQKVTPESFTGFDVVIFSAGGSVSREYAPHAKAAGCVVIDNSSAFRMAPEVPLVVPEINPDDVHSHSGIIANPNCTTAITLMALAPLHRAFTVKKIVAASYQAVSGAGNNAVAELRSQMNTLVTGGAITHAIFSHQIVNNVIPRIGEVLESGYTEEEMKMQNETRKILHHDSFLASMTCVRVPIERAHSVAVAAEFEKPITMAAAYDALGSAEGIKVLDDPKNNIFPTPLQSEHKLDCYVGRLRQDTVFQNGLSFFVSGDQLLKGAAWNALQIFELL